MMFVLLSGGMSFRGHLHVRAVQKPLQALGKSKDTHHQWVSPIDWNTPRVTQFHRLAVLLPLGCTTRTVRDDILKNLKILGNRMRYI